MERPSLTSALLVYRGRERKSKTDGDHEITLTLSADDGEFKVKDNRRRNTQQGGKHDERTQPTIALGDGVWGKATSADS